MNNAEKFKEIFKEFATEVWAFPEKDFLTWLNAEYKEPTNKNDLGVDCIDRAELLKAIDTWDKFGCDADTKLVPYQDHYIPYIHYDDVIKCIKGMPSVTPQEPRKGHWLRRPHVYGVTYCSICDFELKIDNTNYCPNCGAKMKSEVEDGKTD